jgi:hypothetical protein
MGSVPRPKGVKVEAPEGELRISWSTLGYAWPILSIPAALLGLFVCRLATVGPVDLDGVCGLLAFGMLFLGSLYAILVSLLNKTAVEISGRRLEAGSGPVPYRRRQSIDLASVRQVYVAQVGVRHRALKVCVLTQHGTHVTLWQPEMRWFEDGQLALYLEQEIERFLGIPDEVVRGEWRPEPYLWEA